MRLHHFALVVFLLAFAAPAHASLMDMVSDLISTSIPGAPATHTLQFTTTHAIPPGGDIIITPEDGAFTIPPEFSYTDADFAVWDGSAYVDRALAATPSATEDGFAVTASTSGRLAITLSAGQGVPAGSRVQLRLGPNATYGAQGVVSIANPEATGSYRIGIVTDDGAGTNLDYATAMIATVLPVNLTVPLKNLAPIVTSSLPSGEVAAGSKIIEITFSTDRTATCRYSLTPGVAYAQMTNTFSPHLGIFFYMVKSGFVDGATYTYYVRCIGIQGAVSTDDYPLTFSLAATPMSNTSVTLPGTTVGSGNIPNGSEVLYLSTATLTGMTSPGSTVQVLKDGVRLLAVQAGSDGSFHVDATGLERGTYTFSMYSIDSKQRKSATYSSTLTLGAGTSNTVSNIVLPPTMVLDTDQVKVGEKVHVSGSAVPMSGIEVSFISKTDPAADVKHVYATSTVDGTWDLMATGTLAKGIYQVKARQILTAAQSDFSAPAYVGVGQSPSVVASGQSDINGDGKVNLTDFSILLSAWGTASLNADLNGDGTVNLADFSILLFNWTG